TRVRWGKTESKPVTTWPASARWSARAARNMVSPSGIPAVVAVAFPVRTVGVDVLFDTAPHRFAVIAVLVYLPVVLDNGPAHALLPALQIFPSAWLRVPDECRIVLETALIGHSVMSSGRGCRNADASRVERAEAVRFDSFGPRLQTHRAHDESSLHEQPGGRM